MNSILHYGTPPTLEGRHYRHFSISEIIKINQAFMGCWRAHYGENRMQKRNGKDLPYYTHPVEMTDIILDEFRVYEADVIITALLHDTTEPSRIPYFKEGIAFFFGEEIGLYNSLLSKTEGSNETYIDRIIASLKWVVMFVKLVDRLHNMRTLGGLDRKFQKKQVKETRENFFRLCDELAKVIPEKYSKVVPALRGKLQALCEQYGP